VERLRVPNFQAPPGRVDSGMLPAFLPRQLRTWVTGELLERPVANPDRCTGCQTCMLSCPVQAITMSGPGGKRTASGKKTAVMDAAICIRCYCCHELCPENAIDLERGRLGRLLIH
jgi:ferredoxin